MSELLENTMDELDTAAGYKAAMFICKHGDMGNMDKPVAGMIEYLKSAHRTSQQDFWRTIQAVIMEYAKYDHDLRNEASVEFCKAVSETVKQHPLPRF